MKRKSLHAGFTLIEVLVALIIVAFGMGALLATLSSAADTAGVLREKTFAQWIAMNRIAELRLRSIRPEVGKTAGDVEYAGQKWRWFQEVLDPGIAGMLRIDVSVVHASTVTAKVPSPPALAMASGFVGTAVSKPSGIDPDWSLFSLPPVPAAGGTLPGASPGTNPPAAPPAPTQSSAQ